METYTEELFCGNCKELSEHEIPQGTTVKTYVKTAKCSHCKCTCTLRR